MELAKPQLQPEMIINNTLVKFELQNHEIILIGAEKKGLEILSSTFEEVFQQITGGFHARIGSEIEEVQELLLLIKKAGETFDFQQSKTSTVEIKISVEQLRILKQILNEAYNSIKFFDFEKKIGTSRNI